MIALLLCSVTLMAVPLRYKAGVIRGSCRDGSVGRLCSCSGCAAGKEGGREVGCPSYHYEAESGQGTCPTAGVTPAAGASPVTVGCAAAVAADPAAVQQGVAGYEEVVPGGQVAARKAIGRRTILPKVPVILVNYNNMSYRTSRGDAQAMFDKVSLYFNDQSYGAYAPEFDIYGPVTLSQDYSYYGTGNPGNRVTTMVTEACQLMDDSLDFSQYDTDGDGKIDLVYILYAGPPMSDKSGIDRNWISDVDNLVWPHYWSFNSGVTLDGKTIYSYEVSSELDGFYSNDTVAVGAGIGLACHEFGHALGLPDFYPKTGPGAYKTLGTWSIMDYGCYLDDLNTPAGFTAYERWFMGWLTPTQLTDSAKVELQPLNISGESYIVCDEGEMHNLDAESPSPEVCYILENRQQTGWDRFIPGHGLLIYRFNHAKWNENYVNREQGDMGLDIIEADGKSNTEVDGKQGDAFPYDTINSYSPYPTRPILDIQEDGDIIRFTFLGAGASTGVTPVTVGCAAAVAGASPVTVGCAAGAVQRGAVPRLIIRDGQVLICRGSQEYTLQGIAY